MFLTENHLEFDREKSPRIFAEKKMTEKNDRDFLPRKPGWFCQEKKD